MTAPPPQDLGSLARKLATRIMGTDIDGEPDIRTWSPGARVRRIAVTIEDLGRAVVREARQELVIDLMDRIGPLVRELVRTELRREEMPAATGELGKLAPLRPAEQIAQELIETRRSEWGPAGDWRPSLRFEHWHVQLGDWAGRDDKHGSLNALVKLVARLIERSRAEGAASADQELARLRAQRDAAEREASRLQGAIGSFEAERLEALNENEYLKRRVSELESQVAELQEHARKQHALDGERLRDLQEILDGTEAWRGLPEGERAWVLRLLGHLGSAPGYVAALAALRALAPDPERARLREELEEARNAQDFPGG